MKYLQGTLGGVEKIDYCTIKRLAIRFGNHRVLEKNIARTLCSDLSSDESLMQEMQDK